MEKSKRYYLISAAAFALAAVIHVIGYFTNYFYMIGWMMWIPAVCLAVAAVVQIGRDKYIRNPYVSKKKVLVSSQFVLLVITAGYVIFNIIYNCWILRNGGGEYKDNTYYLINLGNRIKEISAGEYSRLLLAEYRLFTGHILLLYACITAYFKIKLMEHDAY